MINLDSTVKQRAYLVSKGITSPLSPATMERLQSTVDFNFTAKVERAIEDCDRDLQILPDDDDVLLKKGKLQASIDGTIEEVRQVLTDIKSEEQAQAQRVIKGREVLAQGKKQIADLADLLTTQAQELNSVDLAHLATAVRGLSK